MNSRKLHINTDIKFVTKIQTSEFQVIIQNIHINTELLSGDIYLIN